MAFQVNANVAALNVYNNLGVHQTKAADSLSRISSGLKASGAGDVSSQGTARLYQQHAGYQQQHQSGSSCDQPATGR